MPHLYNSVLVWGHCPGRIFQIQKKAIRSVFKKKYNAHTNVLFRNHNLLKFDDIYKVAALKLYHKYVNDDLPSYFIDMFAPIQAIHTYNTRNNLRPQVTNKTLTAKCIRYILPTLLNETPSCITEKLSTHSLKGFGYYAKTYICKTYPEKCTIPNCYACKDE